MGTLYQNNLEAYVTETLREFASEHDIEAILDELRENGVFTGYDAEAMNHDTYWAIIANHRTQN